MPKWRNLPSKVKVGNPDSCVAAVTLASDLDIPDVAASGPLKTENIGIEQLVRNVVSNPRIRYIVVCGEESPGHCSGEALLKLHRNGVGESGKIKGAGKMAYVQHLSNEVVDHFREQVEMVDMIGVTDLSRIAEKVDSLPEKEPFPKEIEADILPSVEISDITPSYNTYLTPNIIRVDNISDAWLRSLRRVWSAGNVVEKDQWGSNTKEVQNLVVLISDPLSEPMHHPRFNWDRERLEDYSREYLSPHKGDFEYTYGERLTNWGDASLGEAGFAVDQIKEVVIPELRRSPKTRRAIAVTLNPKIDVSINSPPCMVTNQFLCRSGKLHLTTYFRSHDIFGASLANWFALARLLDFVAGKTGLQPGTITSVSASAHIYESDFSKTVELVKPAEEMDVSAKPHPFQQDPEGYFTIATDSGEIVVQHHVQLHPSGPGAVSATIRGSRPSEIYKTISNLGLFSRYDHAAYLGAELQKAYSAIKSNREYVQDGDMG